MERAGRISHSGRRRVRRCMHMSPRAPRSSPRSTDVFGATSLQQGGPQSCARCACSVPRFGVQTSCVLRTCLDGSVTEFTQKLASRKDGAAGPGILLEMMLRMRGRRRRVADRYSLPGRWFSRRGAAAELAAPSPVEQPTHTDDREHSGAGREEGALESACEVLFMPRDDARDEAPQEAR